MSRPAPSNMPATVGRGRLPGGWRVDDVSGLVQGGLLLQLARDDGEARLEVIVRPPGSGESCARTPMGDLSYRRFDAISEHQAATTTRELARLLESGALPLASYFPHLVAGEDAGIEGSTGRRLIGSVLTKQTRLLEASTGAEIDLPKPLSALYLDPPGIAEFLAPEIEVGGPPVADCVLRNIYLPAVGARESLDFRSYLLEFDRPDGSGVLRLLLSAGGREGTLFGRCGPLSLGIFDFTGEIDALPPEATALASWVLAVLRLKFGPGLRLTVPESVDQVRAVCHPPGRTALPVVDGAESSARSEPRSLNLVLNSDCGQQCSFCSVKSYVRTIDEGDADAARLLVQVRKAQARGVTEVRLNGIDPLEHSRVLELIAEITRAGLERMVVFSSGRRLADDDFRREFLRRAPPDLEISIPLYGVTSQVHEQVTGRAGSHAAVISVLDALAEAERPVAVQVSTLLLRQNVHELPALAAEVMRRGFRFEAALPYPMRQTAADAYANVAVRESEIVDQIAQQLRTIAPADHGHVLQAVAAAIPHPCILWRAERGSGLPLFAARLEVPQRPLVGTEYSGSSIVHGGRASEESSVFAVATHPCPSADRCALAPLCPREMYVVYEELFGASEFEAVGVDELYSAAPLKQAGTA